MWMEKSAYLDWYAEKKAKERGVSVD
jgi:hypothetical protein